MYGSSTQDLLEEGDNMKMRPASVSRSVNSLSRFFVKGSSRIRRHRRGIGGILLAGAVLLVVAAANGEGGLFSSFIPNGVFFPNPSGASQTFSTSGGGIDQTGPFFQSLAHCATASRVWAAR